MPVGKTENSRCSNDHEFNTFNVETDIRLFSSEGQGHTVLPPETRCFRKIQMSCTTGLASQFKDLIYSTGLAPVITTATQYPHTK